MVTFLTNKAFEYEINIKMKYNIASSRHVPLIWLDTFNKINKHILMM